MPKLSKNQALSKLEQVKVNATEIWATLKTSKGESKETHSNWQKNAIATIEHIFGVGSIYIKELETIAHYPYLATPSLYDFDKEIEKKIRRLERQDEDDPLISGIELAVEIFKSQGWHSWREWKSQIDDYGLRPPRHFTIPDNILFKYLSLMTSGRTNLNDVRYALHEVCEQAERANLKSYFVYIDEQSQEVNEFIAKLQNEISEYWQEDNFADLPPNDNRRVLHNKLITAFSMSELSELCFTLDIDPELLDGSNKASNAQSLILYCERTARAEKLIRLCKLTRPNIDW